MRRFGQWATPAWAAAGCGCGPHRQQGSASEEERGWQSWGWQPWAYFSGGFGEGWQFGVKRPLRFLAYKLGLTDEQVGELARLLDELKTERAQAAVDERRTLSAFADAIAGENFDVARAAEGAAVRQGSTDRLRAAVVAALPRFHRLLTPEQRERFAYLIRTGAVTL